MIPMRDGVKLHTVILVPKGREARADPADAHAVRRRQAHRPREQRAPRPDPHGYDNATDVIVEGGYIRVVQDVRGKYGSEGDYVMNRPLRGPLNPTPVDHATDTYDTIDWLVKNVPESNGKVGILGISYDGFLPLMALVNPHPALKVSVPMNPMVDGWMGDDWFHNGAFRQQNIRYIYDQVATRETTRSGGRATSTTTTCSCRPARPASSAAAAASSSSASGASSRAPAYDAFWRDQAVDKMLAAQPLKVPVMLVHSLWDQEDIYGAPPSTRRSSRRTRATTRSSS
jgi:putative CocE/NonD family hydrolase